MPERRPPRGAGAPDSDAASELLKQRLPRLYERALAELEARAQRGEPTARDRLEDLEPPVPVRVVIAGEPPAELWFTAERGGLAAGPPPPEPPRFGHALGVAPELVQPGLQALERGEHGLDLELLLRGFAQLVSEPARKALATIAYEAALVITGVPGIGDVRLRVALGRPELSREPDFELQAAYDDLEDARAEGVGVRQLFLAGKVRVGGDVAKWMLLGMTLAELE